MKGIFRVGSSSWLVQRESGGPGSDDRSSADYRRVAAAVAAVRAAAAEARATGSTAPIANAVTEIMGVRAVAETEPLGAASVGPTTTAAAPRGPSLELRHFEL